MTGTARPAARVGSGGRSATRGSGAGSVFSAVSGRSRSIKMDFITAFYQISKH